MSTSGVHSQFIIRMWPDRGCSLLIVLKNRGLYFFISLQNGNRQFIPSELFLELLS